MMLTSVLTSVLRTLVKTIVLWTIAKKLKMEISDKFKVKNVNF